MKLEQALDLAIALMARASQVSTMIREAQAAGRTELSADEWQQILAAADIARAELTAAIERAKVQGR